MATKGGTEWGYLWQTWEEKTKAKFQNTKKKYKLGMFG